MQVSSLSRLLNDAAVRAETRDAITNRDGLAAIAQSTAHELYGESYTRNKAIHDAEVPNSDDSQRLAQANRQLPLPTAKAAIHSKVCHATNLH